MANDLFVELQEKLEGKKVRIVFPEAYDERVLEAAVKLCSTSISREKRKSRRAC